MTKREANAPSIKNGNSLGTYDMNTKTTKQAATESTTKATPAAGGKRSRRTGTIGGGDREPAPQAGPGRKRRKPFVL